MRTARLLLAFVCCAALAACTTSRVEPAPVEPVVQDDAAMPEDGAIGAMGQDDSATRSVPAPGEPMSPASEPVSEDDGVELPPGDAVEVRVDAGEAPMVEERVVRVVADNWSFSPQTITLRKGQRVTLMLEGKAGVHGFMVPDLGINATVNAGQTASVEIPTDAAGAFAFRCSIPCGPGHQEMTGTIVITER